jgi:hypothetical protein
LLLVGNRYQFFSGVKKMVFLNTVQSQQAEQQGVMIFQASIFEDVPHPNTFFVQVSRNQDRAMTAERLLLGTQNCESKILHSRQQALDSTLKQRRLCDQRVLRPAVAVAGAIFRTRSQFLAQKKIFPPGILKSARQRLAIELRIKATVRPGPDVGDGGNAMLVKERQKTLARDIRMSDGINDSRHGETRMTPAISL